MAEHSQQMKRRNFLSGVATAGAALAAARALGADDKKDAAPAPKFDRKIKAGIIGCGGRGSWIANLFKAHGGYEFVGAADYHADRAEKSGVALGADKAKCYGGLSAYKRLIESGVEAVICETPPYFFPEHTEAAVQAGLHVYMAKPVAVDAPGALKIGELGKAAAQKQRVFHVDYQIPTDPVDIEVVKRMREGALGKLQMVLSAGTSGGDGFNDPPLTGSIESRLVGLIWVNDDALGCGYIGNFDIHIIDAVIWALGRRPVSAYGAGGRYRKQPNGDAYDTNFVTFTFEDGLAWHHQSAAGPTHDWLKQGSLESSIQGTTASAKLSYWQKAYIRGGDKHHVGQVTNLYDEGAKRNIAAFYERVVGGKFENETAQRSVDCTLTCILGREAARRCKLLTMDELIKEGKRLEPDLKGLKA